jgi:uncharacterized protein (TIGR00369 family)
MADAPVDLELMNAAFRDFVPHNKALQLSLISATWSPPQVTIKLPWSERLVGNPETQVLHGGAVTTLLDACCGVSVYLKLKSPQPIATLDLRVDFLGRPPAHRDVFARAECYRATRSVAFVRASAWVDDEAEPFAAATATFALSTQGRALTEEELRKGIAP